MTENNKPLQYRDTTDKDSLMHITEKTAKRIVLEAEESSRHYNNLSIGALLSEDRQKVLWVNKMNPIP